jgi:hypothetical protein
VLDEGEMKPILSVLTIMATACNSTEREAWDGALARSSTAVEGMRGFVERNGRWPELEDIYERRAIYVSERRHVYFVPAVDNCPPCILALLHGEGREAVLQAHCGPGKPRRLVLQEDKYVQLILAYSGIDGDGPEERQRAFERMARFARRLCSDGRSVSGGGQ